MVRQSANAKTTTPTSHIYSDDEVWDHKEDPDEEEWGQDDKFDPDGVWRGDALYEATSDVPTDSEYESALDYKHRMEQGPHARKIGRLLKQAAESAGSYTFGGAALELPVLPGLGVDGCGRVALPLDDPAQFKQLSQCGRLLATDHGTEQDTQGGRAWQFDAGQVKVTNPACDHGLAHLMATVATRLGCPDMPLECHLYKLLLYGPGCHFVRHRDTEKEDRMFATLVIQLPSAHQGGKLIVYQPDGTAVSHDFGAADGTSEFAAHYALHYADAEHELKPVTAGYRLALVYSVCWPRNHKHATLSPALSAHQQLAHIMTFFSKAKESFYFMLEQEYLCAGDVASDKTGCPQRQGSRQSQHDTISQRVP